LPILVNSWISAMLLAREVPRNFLRLAEEFWPGALTLVVDASHRLPLKVTATLERLRCVAAQRKCIAVIESLTAHHRNERESFRIAGLYRLRAGVWAIGDG